jgi:catechol 2,3-dioxygenase-like lactoylglutathione lyase family enzyme
MMTGYGLAYVALAVRDRQAASEILGDDLGLERLSLKGHDGPVPTFGVGATALALFEVGDPFLTSERAGVDHIAFAAEDPRATAEACGFAPDSLVGPGLSGAEQIVIPRSETEGLATRFTTPLGLSGPASEQVERIDHLGIASADNRSAEAIFADRIGLPVESRQTDMEVSIAVESFTSDKYGVVYRNRAPEPVGGLRVSFLTTGDCELEFLQNFDPSHGVEMRHGAAGTTKQDQGAIAGYVAKYGAGLHHIALKTRDIDATLARLGAKGRRLIDTKGRPGSRRALIGFVHPAALGGVLMHFVEREELSDA